MAKPFIKWVGGKRQLLDVLHENLPKDMHKIDTYIEPFVGGGALLFDILESHNFKNVYVFDLNLSLINTYKSIKYNIDELINELKNIEDDYKKLDTDDRKDFYYNKRDLFNLQIKSLNENDINTLHSALFIFLNRTCFNGLYRVNRNGLFNVPQGSYKNPKILDRDALKEANKILQNVTIKYGSYEKSMEFVSQSTLIYCDPPYRPISKQNFKSYNESGFNDESQVKLADFFNLADKKSAKIILSNSDPKNNDENDNFFDDLYSNFNIQRVSATRLVNSKASARNKISEILVKNY